MLCIFAALAVAPVLMIVLGLMTYVIWWYVSREDTSYMHHAQVNRTLYGFLRRLFVNASCCELANSLVSAYSGLRGAPPGV